MKKSSFLIFMLITSLCFSENVCANCNKNHTCINCGGPSMNFIPTPKPCDFSMNAPYKIDLASCPSYVYISSSYLYWTAYEDGLTPYTAFFTNFITNDPRTELASQGTFDCDFNSGFKVGLGWDTGNDNWSISSSYLWYHHTFLNSFNLPNEQISTNTQTSLIFPTFELAPLLYYGNITTPTTLSSKWTLDLDLIDLEMGRKYYVGKCLIFKTSYGLRNTYITQKITQNPDIKFSDIPPPPTQSTIVVNGTMKNTVSHTISSWGVGPRALLDCEWLLKYGLSVKGNISSSLLYTSYTLKATENSLFKSQSGDVLNSDYTLNTLKPCAIRPYLDMGIGLNWGTYLNCHSWYLNLYVGYDIMALWGQNMFRTVRSFPATFGSDDRYFRTCSDDLFLHGLTVELTFNF